MGAGVKFECLSGALPRNSHQLRGVSQFINNAGLQGLCCGKVVRKINGLIQLLGRQDAGAAREWRSAALSIPMATSLAANFEPPLTPMR